MRFRFNVAVAVLFTALTCVLGVFSATVHRSPAVAVHVAHNDSATSVHVRDSAPAVLPTLFRSAIDSGGGRDSLLQRGPIKQNPLPLTSIAFGAIIGSTATVRAKFKFDSYSTTLHSRYPHRKDDGSPDYGKPEAVELRTLKFSPVYANSDPNHENSKFWNASPSGSLELGTVNPEAWSAFQLGKEYYLDFTPAE